MSARDPRHHALKVVAWIAGLLVLLATVVVWRVHTLDAGERAVDADGHARPGLVAAAEKFSAALSHGDRSALEAMGASTSDPANVNRLLAGVGGSPVRVRGYSDSMFAQVNADDVDFTVSCPSGRTVTFFQRFDYVKNGLFSKREWRPDFGVRAQLKQPVGSPSC